MRTFFVAVLCCALFVVAFSLPVMEATDLPIAVGSMDGKSEPELALGQERNIRQKRFLFGCYTCGGYGYGYPYYGYGGYNGYYGHGWGWGK